MKVQKVLVKTVGGQYAAEVVNDEPDRFGRIRLLFNDSTDPEWRPVAAVIFLENEVDDPGHIGSGAGGPSYLDRVRERRNLTDEDATKIQRLLSHD